MTSITRRRVAKRATAAPMRGVHARLLGNPEVRFYYDQLKFRDEIGTTIAAARERAGLTQTQVAEKARTTQSVIARIEGCRGGIPSLPLLDRIARAIGFRLAVSLCRERAA
jgi:ribosome-binding protein aMBF1 (putative translation factor)